MSAPAAESCERAELRGLLDRLALDFGASPFTPADGDFVDAVLATVAGFRPDDGGSWRGAGKWLADREKAIRVASGYPPEVIALLRAVDAAEAKIGSIGLSGSTRNEREIAWSLDDVYAARRACNRCDVARSLSEWPEIEAGEEKP